MAVLPNVHPQNVKRLATQGEAERSRFAASRRKLNGDPHHLPQLCSPPRAQRAAMRHLQDALLRTRLPGAALETRWPKAICQEIKRGGGAEQYHADKKLKEAVAVAAEACADDTSVRMAVK